MKRKKLLEEELLVAEIKNHWLVVDKSRERIKMEQNNREILECNEQEDSSFELYSNYIGIFGYIRLTQSKTYYVFYPEFRGFLKAKHTIFITQELNRLNKYDSYKEKMKHER